MTQVTR